MIDSSLKVAFGRNNVGACCLGFILRISEIISSFSTVTWFIVLRVRKVIAGNNIIDNLRTVL